MKHQGLTSEEAQKRQIEFGKNSLPDEKAIPAIRLFLSQFANPLVYILLFAALISGILREYFDIGLILSVVVINAFMGFFQENKTQKTLLALKKLIKPHAKVFRDGERQDIEASDLVPGDVVILGMGDKIPADGKIIENITFFVNEAILTGESEAVEKKESEEVFMGTVVSSGRAVMRVIKTGLSTKIGEITQTLKKTEQPPTTLQIRLKRLTHILIIISIALSLLIFTFGFWTGRDLLKMLELSAVILVAIIPEALLIVITLVLVLAMRNSLKKKALIRKILAVETLGSVTMICTDKTGTLTEGKMKVSETDFSDEENSHLAMCLCNDRNDTLEIALWEYLKGLENFKQQKIYDKYNRVFEIPFGSEHKFMMTIDCLAEKDSECLALVKGAPEIVLEMSNLSQEEKEAIKAKTYKWAEKGLKVLGLAYKKISKGEIDEIREKKIHDFDWGGVIGLWDPPREDAQYWLPQVLSGEKIKGVFTYGQDDRIFKKSVERLQ